MDRKPDPSRIVLRAKGLTKRYAGVTALNQVDFDLREGEVHCLVGENGAGKSTLIKILTGAVIPDEGIVEIDGHDATRAGIKERRRLGISPIYQDLNLVPQLTVAQNIFLGNELRTKTGALDQKRMSVQASALIRELGVSFPVNVRVDELGMSLQQLTATARALSLGGRILIMDEPSAVLGGKELDVLFGVVKSLTDKGIAIIYISHRLEEIFHIGDRVTVLRDGKHVATTDVGEINQSALVRQMVGRDIEKYENKSFNTVKGEEILKVEGLTRRGVLEGISFSVREGEVVGIAGLVGAGRTELARAIMGLDPIDSGVITWRGVRRRVNSATAAVRLGMALVPEDRRAEGIVSMLSVRENASLSLVSKMSGFGIIRFARMHAIVRDLAKGMSIKVPDLRNQVSGLSGGNQQKVVLAKCLASDCRLLIMDEPTVGIDVGAKKEIYNLIGDLKKRGIGVIVISSELAEVLSISDRILVMAEGTIRGEVDPRTTSQEAILDLALPRMTELTTAPGGAQ